jgi:fatty acid desaturase
VTGGESCTASIGVRTTPAALQSADGPTRLEVPETGGLRHDRNSHPTSLKSTRIYTPGGTGSNPVERTNSHIPAAAVEVRLTGRRHALARHQAASPAADTLTKLDNWHGPLALATDWAWICAVVAAVNMLRGWAWLVAEVFVALPLIGARQRALATLLHEAAHETLARGRRLNRILGTVPSGWLILQSLTSYRRSHVRGHHGRFADPRLDPDFRAHLDAGLYEPQSGRAFALRFLILPLFGLRHPAIIRELVRSRLGGGREDALRSVGALGYVAALCVAVTLLGGGRLLICYWLLPLVVVFPLINWYIEILEHFPLLHQRSNLYRTRHRAMGPVSRLFVGIHNEGYHLDHHLSPRTPFWNLPAAHAARMRDPAFAAAVCITTPPARSVLGQFVDIVRRVDATHRCATSGRYGTA